MEITLAKFNQTTEIYSLLKACKEALDDKNIFQWIDSYPTLEIIKQDINDKCLYCLMNNSACVGVISINSIQEDEYRSILWEDKNGKILVIHRLAVHPQHQRKGFATKLMDFAEMVGFDNNYSSIRLDAYSENIAVLNFYELRNYKKRGEVFFSGRKAPFVCYEKSLRYSA